MKPEVNILLVGVMAVTGAALVAQPARATVFNDLFVFGDSYSDTGSFAQYSNGPTAVGNLAKDLGIPLTTSQTINPGSSGVNFAQTAAKITVGPTPPKPNPLSINQQVGQFASYVANNAVSFNPASTLFFLEEGLNDASTPVATVVDAITNQVAQLYRLGARTIELTSLPYDTGFNASAKAFNAPYAALVPTLQTAYPDATIALSNFGGFLDQVQANPGQYGLTNATDACVNGNQVCATPGTYFFYYGGHPSAATSVIVGQDLYQEALALPAATAVPEPTTLSLFGLALGGLALATCRRSGRR